MLGYDGGVAFQATDSDGRRYPNGRHGPRRAKATRRAARKLSRARRGSANRDRAKSRLARLRRREADGRSTASRTNAARLVTAALEGGCRAVAREDLDLRAMTRSAAGTADEPGTNVAAKRGLDRALADAALGAFARDVGGKAERAGLRVVKVDPRRTSMTCSGCGVADEAVPGRAHLPVRLVRVHARPRPQRRGQHPPQGGGGAAGRCEEGEGTRREAGEAVVRLRAAKRRPGARPRRCETTASTRRGFKLRHYLPLPFVLVFCLRAALECLVTFVPEGDGAGLAASHAAASRSCLSMGVLAVTLMCVAQPLLDRLPPTPASGLATRVLMALLTLSSAWTIAECLAMHRLSEAVGGRGREPWW